jgi:hypothetical protein
MELSIKTDFRQVQRRLDALGRQMPFAASVALNKTAEWVETELRREMRKVFDKPTPFFLRSLRVVRSTKTKLEAKVWFKDLNSAESASRIAMPHIVGGRRSFKGAERRLRSAGLLPGGWFAVPGAGAKIDGYGNQSRGEVSALLNFVGTYREAGFNTSNPVTLARRKRKTGKSYFVAKVDNKSALEPGIYMRQQFAKGAAIKPMMIFVKSTAYKRRFDFFGVGRKTIARRFPEEANKAIALAIRTAR